MTLERCIKKEIAETELDEMIAGDRNVPRFEKLEYSTTCYDCDGYNTECPLYKTEKKLIEYDSFLAERVRGKDFDKYGFRKK